MLFNCVCKLCCFQTPVSCGICRRLLIMLLTDTWKLRFPKAQGLASDKNVIKEHWSALHDHMTVAECISLNSIANVVYFDNKIFQSSATRSAMRQTSGFHCENKWRYEPDGCRISDLRLFLSLETERFYGSSLLPWLFSVSYYVECMHCREEVGRCWNHWGRPWLSLFITRIRARDLSNTKDSLLSLQNKNCCNSLLHLEYQWSTKNYLRETKLWRIRSLSYGQICGGIQNSYH